MVAMLSSLAGGLQSVTRACLVDTHRDKGPGRVNPRANLGIDGQGWNERGRLQHGYVRNGAGWAKTAKGRQALPESVYQRVALAC